MKSALKRTNILKCTRKSCFAQFRNHTQLQTDYSDDIAAMMLQFGLDAESDGNPDAPLLHNQQPPESASQPAESPSLVDDAEQFFNFFASGQRRKKEDTISKIFEEADDDHNGTLTIEEFRHAARRYHKEKECVDRLSKYLSDAMHVNFKQLQSDEWTRTGHKAGCDFYNIPGERCMGYATVHPGGWLRTHKHPHFESYIALSGKAEVTVGEKVVRVEPGSLVHIPSFVTHGIHNPFDEPFVFLYVFPTLKPEEKMHYVFEDGNTWKLKVPTMHKKIEWEE